MFSCMNLVVAEKNFHHNFDANFENVQFYIFSLIFFLKGWQPCHYYIQWQPTPHKSQTVYELLLQISRWTTMGRPIFWSNSRLNYQ